MAARDLGQSSSESKGVLLALLILDAGESACAAFATGERETILKEWRALGRLGDRERESLVRAWCTEVGSGFVWRVNSLHPTWIEDALVAEPPDLAERVRDIVSGSPRRPASSTRPGPALACVSDGDLACLALGHLAPLCEGEFGPLAASLCAMPFADLVHEVTLVGARNLGHSLVGSDAAVRSRAMAMAGPPWAEVIERAASEAISNEVRMAAAASVAGPMDKNARTPSERLLHLGLRALETTLSSEHPGSLARVAGRLPVPLGRRLLGW